MAQEPLRVVRARCALDTNQRALMDMLKPLIRANLGPDWHVIEREKQQTGPGFKPLKAAGFKYVGEGMFRKGFLFNNDKCVLKTAKGVEGMEHMRTENETWKTAPPGLKEWLVPVVDEDPEGYWNTMPAVERYLTRGKMSNEEITKAQQTQRLLNQQLEKHDWVCDDLHLGNIGRSHNLPVALDYGFGCERLSERKKRRPIWSDDLEFELTDEEWKEILKKAEVRKAFEGMGPKEQAERREQPATGPVPAGVRVTWGGSEAPPAKWWETMGLGETRKRGRTLFKRIK